MHVNRLRPFSLLIAGLALAATAEAQTPRVDITYPVGSANDGAPVIADVPFGPGERATYKVSVGLFGSVGEGSMEVVSVDTIHGHPTYQLRFDLEGGVLFAKVDDTFRSWMDVSSLFSRRFEQRQHEVNFRRHRIFDFLPEDGKWERIDRDETGDLASNEPLDDVSFLYFVRTIPLEVGETYTFHRYYREDSNPVILKVLRRERVNVPAGTFDTIVVQPIIKTDGLFGEGGEAEVYFTDDDQRILVQMRSRVPILRHLNLVLESYTPGMPLSQTGVTP